MLSSVCAVSGIRIGENIVDALESSKGHGTYTTNFDLGIRRLASFIKLIGTGHLQGAVSL